MCVSVYVLWINFTIFWYVSSNCYVIYQNFNLFHWWDFRVIQINFPTQSPSLLETVHSICSVVLRYRCSRACLKADIVLISANDINALVIPLESQNTAFSAGVNSFGEIVLHSLTRFLIWILLVIWSSMISNFGK